MHPRHCDIFKARDGQYYARLETLPYSEQFDFYGPFAVAGDALSYLQQAHAIGAAFYLDETGRRPVPAAAQPAGTAA